MKSRTKTGYVEGFVFTIEKKNLAKYKKMAKEAEQVWMKYGALDYKECYGVDLDNKPMGGMPAPLSFKTLTKAKPTETVWFSYITYKSKAHKKEVDKKVMAYFDKKYADKMDEPMPFDVSRMARGGFAVLG